MIRVLSRRTGMPDGICAGQGWESEAEVNLSAYHRAKTGALFIAATQMGALAAGQDCEPWEELGARIGEAFQVADDLKDALLTEAEMGKPAGQDMAHARPSAVKELGVLGAVYVAWPVILSKYTTLLAMAVFWMTDSLVQMLAILAAMRVASAAVFQTSKVRPNSRMPMKTIQKIKKDRVNSIRTVPC